MFPDNQNFKSEIKIESNNFLDQDDLVSLSSSNDSTFINEIDIEIATMNQESYKLSTFLMTELKKLRNLEIQQIQSNIYIIQCFPISKAHKLF